MSDLSGYFGPNGHIPRLKHSNENLQRERDNALRTCRAWKARALVAEKKLAASRSRKDGG